MSSRLREVFELSYRFLKGKINGGRIVVENEASLQLHFASILKDVGELFVASKNEVFSIELEKPVTISDSNFRKSGTDKAKIDVFFAFVNVVSGESKKCAIEMKYFKKKNHREPNNRYDVFSDVHNLESYGEFADVCYMMVGTDHLHYVNQGTYSADTCDFDFRHGAKYMAGTKLVYNTEKPYDSPITLKNSYEFNWDHFDGGINFLRFEVPVAISP